MTKKIFIAGATGLIGYPLCERLVQMDYEVAGLTTSETGKQRLADIGVKGYVGNILDKQQVMQAISDFQPDIVINQITDLKKVNMQDNAKVRIEGTKNLVDAALQNNVSKMIAQSLAFTYAPGPGFATEETPLDTDNTESSRKATVDGVVALEKETKRIPDHVILRFGYLYGPGTWYGKNGMIHNRFYNGTLHVHDGFISFIHLDDAVQASLDAIHFEPGIYNVVDDAPVKYDEWANEYAEMLGEKPDINVTKAESYERGASNEKFKKQLGTLKYPTWKDGFENK